MKPCQVCDSFGCCASHIQHTYDEGCLLKKGPVPKSKLTWYNVWRKAIGPKATVEALMALRKALEEDDPRLVQGATTVPPPLMCVMEWPCENACALSFLGWTEGATVGEVEERFARWCFEIDEVFGEPAACRAFIQWFDETPRETMRSLLLREVNDSIEDHRINNLVAEGERKSDLSDRQYER